MFSRLPGITSEVVSSLFLFHWVLRCFTSPGARRTPMYSVHDNAAFPALGYPIRIFPDHRLLATSPELFAGCYVLLRRALSSHPPYALMLYNHSQRRFQPHVAASIHQVYLSPGSPTSSDHELQVAVSRTGRFLEMIKRVIVCSLSDSIVKGLAPDPSSQVLTLVARAAGSGPKVQKTALGSAGYTLQEGNHPTSR